MQRVDIHAFVSEHDARHAVEQGLSDRRLNKARPTFFDGTMQAAAAKYADEDSPGLLIVETRDAPADIFTQLDHLSDVCRAETGLILLGRHNDVGLYRQLARRGVREYIPLPVDSGHFVEAVLGVCGNDDGRQGKLVSFIGANGGAGSTTVANNVAWQLAKSYDGEAILVDLDLAFGTVGLDFNLESPQTSAQALAQADRLDDQMLQRFVAKYSDNLSLLTSAADGSTAPEIDIAALDQTLKILRRNATWVLVDLPRSWSPWVRHVLNESDEIVLTATPTLASLRNAKMTAEVLNTARAGRSSVQIVFNRVGANARADIPLKDFAGTLGNRPAAQIAHEPALFSQAANIGQMLGETAKGQRALDSLGRLTSSLSGQTAVDKRKGGATASLLHRLLFKPK